MTIDNPDNLSPTPPDPHLEEAPEKNGAESGQNRTFSDIDPNYQLSSAQCAAIDLALNGLRWSQIARTLNVSPKTLWRWKTKDKPFQEALADARADRRDFAVERCQTLASRASSVLAEFLTDSKDRNRMRAAQILLQSAARFAPLQSPKPRDESPSISWIEQALDLKSH